MEMPASRASASCNQEAEASSSWRSMAPSLGSLLRRLRRAPQMPNVYRYNPENAGVGVLSAVMDPAAGACLRVVGPVLIRSGALGILEVALLSLCCSHRRPIRAAVLSCGRCSHWIGGGAVYMYKGEIGFCKPECRDAYITEEWHRDTKKRAGGSPAPKGVRSRGREKVPTMVDGKDGDTSSIFFTCADIL